MKDIPKGFYRISVKALVLDEEGKFMLLKQDDNMWDLPGGGLEYGENPKEALKREILEEMGIEVISIEDKPVYFFTFTSLNGIPFANVLYLTKLKHFDFTPSRECKELKFFTKEEAQKAQLHSNIQKFIEIMD